MTENKENLKNTNVKDENLKFEKIKKPTKLEQAEKQAAEYKDLALRRMAELENYRRNNLNVQKDTRERTIGEVISAILPAIDAFGRAETMITDEKTKNGVNIIKEQLLNVLKRYDVTPIETVGMLFNPSEQECIMQVDNPDLAGKVVYEIEKGYKIGEKVLRYSKVAVGKEETTDENK